MEELETVRLLKASAVIEILLLSSPATSLIKKRKTFARIPTMLANFP